jgi:hypothetical protein
MLSLFEIFGTCLVTFSFIKNSKNWIENVFITSLYFTLVHIFLHTVDKYHSLEGFISGEPICSSKFMNDITVCIHYDALFTYLIGQILWCYYAMPKFRQNRNTRTKLWFYYFFHSIPLIAMLGGFVNNWNFYIQVKTDLILIIVAMLNYDFEMFVWFGCCKEIEQIDQGNFSNFHSNILHSTRFDESVDVSSDESVDESNDVSSDESVDVSSDESVDESVDDVEEDVSGDVVKKIVEEIVEKVVVVEEIIEPIVGEEPVIVESKGYNTRFRKKNRSLW